RVKVGGTRNVEIADPSLTIAALCSPAAAQTPVPLHGLKYWRGAPGTDGQFQAGSKQGDRCSGTGAGHFDVRVELSSGPKDLRCYRAVPKLRGSARACQTCSSGVWQGSRASTKGSTANHLRFAGRAG